MNLGTTCYVKHTLAYLLICCVITGKYSQHASDLLKAEVGRYALVELKASIAS